jgi:hypothetical protein
MPRVRDPLHWARKAAQHPAGNLEPDRTYAVSNLYLFAISKFGDALYKTNDNPPGVLGFWCHEIKSGAWRPWTRYEHGNRGYIPLPPPLPIHANPVQPPNAGPRWHILTPDDLYNAQRLRIDPTWQP